MPSTKKLNPTNKPKTTGTSANPKSVSKSNSKSKPKVASKPANKNLIFGKPPKFWSRKILITLAILLPVLFVYDMIIGGNMIMYTRWIECGRKPVAALDGGLKFVTRYKGWNGGSDVPHYAEPHILTTVQPRKFYCTPHEAEMHGYSANKYEYQFKHRDQ